MDGIIDPQVYVARKKTLIHNIIRYADRLSRWADQPYAIHLPPPTPPRGNFYVLYTPSPSVRHKEVFVLLPQTRLLLVGLAIHAYRAEHGADPPTLAALVPGYLNAVPQDPFTRSPLKYHRTARGCLLYSIGPDGVDDGGRPSADGHTSLKSLRETSAGDIVAGVNVW